jgi:hypothetical protein
MSAMCKRRNPSYGHKKYHACNDKGRSSFALTEGFYLLSCVHQKTYHRHYYSVDNPEHPDKKLQDCTDEELSPISETLEDKI